jgi:ribulose-5-phosphate 4-epimerase/fuculose-1-phosphate aldolase
MATQSVQKEWSKPAAKDDPYGRRRRNDIPEAEWRTRVDLAACYRLVALNGWDDILATHISARVPGKRDEFLINPFGLTFEEITASDLVRIDVDGNALSETPYQVNPAGFTIHSAIHMARHDAECVLHLHTLDGMAVSAMADGLLPLNQTSMFAYGDVAYHDFEGVALDLDERERLQRDLADKHYMILRNHGTLVAAATVPEAFIRMYFLERACTSQVRTLSGGRAVYEPSLDAQEKTAVVGTRAGGYAKLAWPALLRRLDRQSPGYEA